MTLLMSMCTLLRAIVNLSALRHAGPLLPIRLVAREERIFGWLLHFYLSSLHGQIEPALYPIPSPEHDLKLTERRSQNVKGAAGSVGQAAKDAYNGGAANAAQVSTLRYFLCY